MKIVKQSCELCEQSKDVYVLNDVFYKSWNSKLHILEVFNLVHFSPFLCLSLYLPIATLPIHQFCQLIFSILFPMFWFPTNVERGITECHLLDIPKVLLSSHIFYLVCLRLMYIQLLIPMCLVWKLVEIFLLPL